MSTIQVQDEQGVRIIRFNRPDKRNALDLDMYKQLTEYLIQGEADNEIRAFLLTGSENCFTSGNDVADFLKQPDLGPNHPAVRFLFCLLELKSPWSPLSAEPLSESGPRCCCIVTWSMPITQPSSACPLSTWHWCLKPAPACYYLNWSAIKRPLSCCCWVRVSMPKRRWISNSSTAC